MADDGRVYVGVDLGGTNCQIGVVSPDGEVLSRAKRKTEPQEGRDAVLDRIVSGVEEACREARVDTARVAALGIGVPGPVDPHRGVCYEAPNLAWQDVPVAQLLGERLRIPVTVDNDVNVALYGELRRGVAVGATTAMACWVGTGVGGAFVFGGKLFYGHHHTAGEIGHMVILPSNPPGLRSLEHNCSRTAVANRVRALIEAGRESIVTELVEGKLSKIKSRTIAEAYARSDELVTEVVHDAADRLGILLGSLITALSLEKIVLGGGLTEAIGTPFVELVRASAHAVAFPKVCRSCDVVASVLEDNAGVIGAAILAKESATA